MTKNDFTKILDTDVYKRQVLMCIAQVSKMADEEMEEIKKERIDKE